MEDEPEDRVQLGSSHTKDGLEGVRLKRDIDDGRQINSEAYADVRRKNYGRYGNCTQSFSKYKFASRFTLPTHISAIID